MPTCDDLRIGGTLSPTGITGGISINGTALSVADWSGIFGHPGFRSAPLDISGRPGVRVVGQGLPRGRFFNLDLNVGVLNPQGTLTVSECEQKQANTDSFLSYLADPAGAYLEVDMPDQSKRFIYVYAVDPSFVSQPRKLRTIRAPLVSSLAYWHVGGNESTDTISGADTLVAGGNVNIYDPVLTFAGDGTFQHTGLGWELEIAGSGGPVTVNLGTRTVTEGGNPAPNLLRRNHRDWGWFTPGNNSVTSDVSVTVTWRNQYA